MSLISLDKKKRDMERKEQVRKDVEFIVFLKKKNIRLLAKTLSNLTIKLSHVHVRGNTEMIRRFKKSRR